VGEYHVVAFGGIKFSSVHLPFADQVGRNDVAFILNIISLSFSLSLSYALFAYSPSSGCGVLLNFV
jgi:hypothetical protein